MSIQHLDTLVRTGDVLSKAVDSVTRDELRALADRFGVNGHRPTPELRRVVKRELVLRSGDE